MSEIEFDLVSDFEFDSEPEILNFKDAKDEYIKSKTFTKKTKTKKRKTNHEINKVCSQAQDFLALNMEPMEIQCSSDSNYLYDNAVNFYANFAFLCVLTCAVVMWLFLKSIVLLWGNKKPNRHIENFVKRNIRKVRKIGHRGFSKNAPENTLESIDFISKLSYKAIEIDIRSTKDGKLVLMHDSSVERTTNGLFISFIFKVLGRGFLRDFVSSEIEKLNACIHFNNKKYSNCNVPTLEDAIQCCIRNEVYILMDVKESDQFVFYIIDGILYYFKKYHWLYSHCVVCSFDWNLIYKIRNMDGDIVGGLSIMQGDTSILINSKWLINLYQSFLDHFILIQFMIITLFIGNSFILAEKSFAKKSFIKIIECLNIEPVFWTVNDIETKEKIVKMDKINISKRLDFCTDHRSWSMNDWKKVIFSDECNVDIKRGHIRQKIWRRKTEPLEQFTICKNNRFSTSVMIWDITEWIEENKIQLIRWPSNSPNLNIIKHVWSRVKIGQSIPKIEQTIPANVYYQIWSKTSQYINSAYRDQKLLSDTDI
ncbi:Membrane-interacting protein of RGS16 [Intoshia linei]|uniref:Membrane-interacting protein of RGS16 n=1 Tax=Intoshia linei TaxID=1819745 RepID=A0A177B9T6_9BILA|nr:Membrane-interacting protein of RGS16 [Intoshia linei]